MQIPLAQVMLSDQEMLSEQEILSEHRREQQMSSAQENSLEPEML